MNNPANSFKLINAATDTCADRLRIHRLAGVFRALMNDRGAPADAALSLVIRDRFLLAQCVLAGLLSGLTIAPVNPDLSVDEMANVLAMADAKLLITDSEGVQEAFASLAMAGNLVEDVANEAEVLASDSDRSDALLGNLLIFTSGTTGDPKGVLLKGAQLAHNAHTAVQAFGFSSSWVTASILPLFHTFTLVSDLLTMWQVGGTCVVCAPFNAAAIPAISQAFAQYGVHAYAGVPIVFKMLGRFAAPEHFKSVRLAIAGAAPLYEDTRLAYARLGHEVLPCYGLSEACCFVAISPPGAVVPRTVGRPTGLELLVLAEDEGGIETPAGTGERGEICIRGNAVMPDGYWKRPQSGVDSYVSGFFRTGDIGFLDQQGYLHITGRRKNMLIQGGEKYYLEDFDRILAQLPEVRDSACIVTECKENHEAYACCLVIDGELNEDLAAQVRAHLVSRFGTKAAPSRIVRLNEIPRTPTGKTKIDLLRQLVETSA